MAKTHSTPPETTLWAMTSTWHSDEEPSQSGAWTTIYATRAEAVTAAEEIAEEIRAEGNPGEADEQHLQADDPQGPRSTWTWDGENGDIWTGQVEPLELGRPYGT